MVGPEFASCWLKIGRAQEHFKIFDSELGEWTESKPYSILQKSDPEGCRHTLVLELKRPFPADKWSLIAGDCIHNLRCALDHLVYALAVKNSGTNPPQDAGRLQFPITSSLEQFERQRDRIKGLSDKAQTFIEQRQPYNVRTKKMPPQLAILSGLDNADKHRLLTVTFNHLMGGKITFVPPRPANDPPIHWIKTAVSDGTPVAFFEMSPPQHVCYRYDVSFCVTVAHVPGPTGWHVTPLEVVLRSLIEEVTHTVNLAVGL